MKSAFNSREVKNKILALIDDIPHAVFKSASMKTEPGYGGITTMVITIDVLDFDINDVKKNKFTRELTYDLENDMLGRWRLE